MSFKEILKLKEGKEVVRDEIERRFLALKIDYAALRKTHQIQRITEIRQGYLSDGRRIREEVDEKGRVIYTITQKKEVRRSQGLVNEETETRISRDDFDGKWTNTEGARISKTRYYLSDGVEVNVLHGSIKNAGTGEMVNVEGRVLIEKDFRPTGNRLLDQARARLWQAPDWFTGLEVTDVLSSKKIAMGADIPSTEIWKPLWPAQEFAQAA